MKSYTEFVSAAGSAWIRSSHSGNNTNCVEVAGLREGDRAVRDSKRPEGPVLRFGSAGFRAFLDGVVDGSFR